MRHSSYPLLSSQKLYQIMPSKPQLLAHLKEALVCLLRLSLQCPVFGHSLLPSGLRSSSAGPQRLAF